VQAVQVEVGLIGKAAVRNHPWNDVKVEAVIRQVELQEPMDHAILWRLAVVGSPDRIEAVPPPAPRQERERTELQRRRKRSLLEAWRSKPTPMVTRVVTA
jgi:hypothetical protein